MKNKNKFKHGYKILLENSDKLHSTKINLQRPLHNILCKALKLMS